MWTEGSFEKSCLDSMWHWRELCRQTCEAQGTEDSKEHELGTSEGEHWRGPQSPEPFALHGSQLGFCKENNLSLTISLSRVQVRKQRHREHKVAGFVPVYRGWVDNTLQLSRPRYSEVSSSRGLCRSQRHGLLWPSFLHHSDSLCSICVGGW